MNEETIFYKGKFSKAHISFSFIFFLFMFVKEVSGSSVCGTKGIIYTFILLGIDICIEVFKVYDKQALWYVLRVIELLLTITAYLYMITNVIATFLAILLVLSVLELLMANDFLDSYSRTLTIILTACPGMLYMVVMLFVKPEDQMEFFGCICCYGALTLSIALLSRLIANIINTADNKVFELRRLSENLTNANDALRIQQDKVKKANEELGIQKIKLETAYNRINSVNAETTIQNQILKYISTSLEITTLLDLITESIFEAIGLDLCAAVIQPGIAGNSNILYRVRSRLGKNSENQLSEKIEWGCLDAYIKVEGTYTDNQVNPGEYTFLEDISVNSLLIVPLVRDNLILGALICGKAQYEYFHDNILFFETVVTQLLVAIHNASLYAKMQQMAIRDSLTGIYNRGQLNIMLDQYSKEARDSAKPLSVALMDIDHFKRINDTYGHLFGDIVIKEIARIAQNISHRYKGIAARYGGEEFVLVIPNKGVSACTDIVNELRDLVSKAKFNFEGETVTARVSVGISTYPETCTHITELLNRADGAMYYAKKNGRNQLAIDSDEIYEAVRKSI